MKHKGTTTHVEPHVREIDYKTKRDRTVSGHVSKQYVKTSNKTFYTLRIIIRIKDIDFSFIYVAVKSYSEIKKMIDDYTKYSCNLSMDETIKENITENIRGMGESMKTIMSGTNIFFANETNCKNRAEKINDVIKLLLETVVKVEETHKGTTSEVEGRAIVADIMGGADDNDPFWDSRPYRTHNDR